MLPKSDYVSLILGTHDGRRNQIPKIVLWTSHSVPWHIHTHTHIHKSFLERKRLCLWKLGFHWRLFLFCFIEPNLLSGTAHSVNKRGVKRRDLDIEELREVLSSLLPFVRIEHILPINSEVLNDAVSLFLHYFQRKKNAKLILY